MNYTIITMGCKVNQYESQAMEQWMAERGHTEVGPGEAFDLAIVNTCTVTAVADKKNRNVIRRLRKQCPQAVLAVCGCYSQVKPEDVRALGVDVISGSAGREAFLELALAAVTDRQKRESLDEALRRREFEILPPGGLAARTRAMLKIQDGCSNFCSYCIIPFARGPVRSLPLEEALAQVEELVEAGYREIVVTGIEIASWGVDLDKTGALRLPQLLDEVCRAAGEVRIRLGSLEPRIIDETFCALLEGHKNLCPHFHLSMQSGSDTVLARMHRRYDTARYYESVALLKARFPGCAVTTDMIVGFPGETEAEFAESLAFIRKCGFASMHIFPYSRRPGTPADKLPGQLGNAVKEARSAAAIAVAAEMNRGCREAMIGTLQAVLFEEEANAFPLGERWSAGQDEGSSDEASGLRHQASGDEGTAPSTPLRSAQDDRPVGGGAPDARLWTGHAPNSIRVYAPGADLHNRVLPVRITALYEDGVAGRIEY
ncbi:MAG: tRNA (N(6)-L-threonylcarbamoyladenosine(37)-C(2))-methylthiotransferase MtaB [Oscillospiraceae bacterium]|nr:tRNA (N(6)-L-threonylcarbamoyladenosine(37)-C(2))-methylthiotransferase MtaB [Oscillospiraceae bacterium]